MSLGERLEPVQRPIDPAARAPDLGALAAVRPGGGSESPEPYSMTRRCCSGARFAGACPAPSAEKAAMSRQFWRSAAEPARRERPDRRAAPRGAPARADAGAGLEIDRIPMSAIHA